MKINELKINSYGNLKNKNIQFEDGINIVYGENEKGKSTILKYIVNSFYGTSKNKKGREVSDFEKFKPWNSDEFSGTLTYTLDNSKQYEIFREFSKKNPKLYDENKEDVSKEYSIDKSLGNQFFYEQTKVDENTFTSSVMSFQNEVEIDETTQNVLLQKMANSSSTGDDNISYKKALEKLAKKQLDEIGTSRSQGKPINLVINEINSLNNRKEQLKQYEDYKYEIEDKSNNIQEEIAKLKGKSEYAKEYKSICEQEKIERDKLKYNEKQIDEIENKIQKLIEQKKQLNNQKNPSKEIKNEKIKILPYAVIEIFLIALTIVFYLVIKSVVLAIVPLALMFILAGIFVFKRNKIKKKNSINEINNSRITKGNEEIQRRVYEIDAQIELLEKNREEQIENAEKIRNETISKFESNKEELNKKYGSMTGFCFSERDELIKVNSEVEHIQNLINEKNIELHRIKLDKENIMPKLDELAENEEKMAQCEEMYNELLQKNKAIETVKEILESSYQKLKNDIAPVFNQKWSENICKISGGKYRRIIISEDNGVMVELPSGEFKEASRLSYGTIQQIHLSFRLSVAQNLTDETMPIILDESFAYYDDIRLKETLKNINELFVNNHQIIIFTCTNREEQALKELQYNYNKVVL